MSLKSNLDVLIKKSVKPHQLQLRLVNCQNRIFVIFVITSFYRHPLSILTKSHVSADTGLTAEKTTWISAFCPDRVKVSLLKPLECVLSLNS